MSRPIPYLLLFLLIAFSSSGQDKQLAKKLEDYLSPRFSPVEPGCDILVSTKGQVIYSKAFGNANLELNTPLKTGMLFSLASITKQFTAVAILQLLEQGKISLLDSLQKFIPDYPAKGQTITIENLLTHTSGIRDYLQIEYTGMFMERWDFSPGQLIDSFKNRPLDFEPGTRFSYSNSGYYLLGYIIEKISGKSYQQYIKDNLLTPLGMTNTYFDSAGIIIPNRVNGYQKERAAYRNEDYWSPTIKYAAGGLISNLDDLLKWHKGLYSYQVLKKETLQKALTPYRLKDGTFTGYGYGWFLKTANGIRSIEHGGGLPGFRSNEVYFPDQDIFVAALCNCGSAPIDEISVGIAGLALNRSLQPDLAIDTATLNKYTGVYRLSIDSNRTMTLMKDNGRLVAKISENEIFPLLFESETKFQFKNMVDVRCKFVLENGKVTKFNVDQSGHYEWIRMQ